MKGKLCVMSPVLVSTNCYVPYFFTFTVIIQFVIINSPAVFSLRSLSFVNDSCKKVHFEFWGKIKICATASFASFFPLLYLLWAEVRWSETRNVQKSWMCNIWPGEREGGTALATLINASKRVNSDANTDSHGFKGTKAAKYKWRGTSVFL